MADSKAWQAEEDMLTNSSKMLEDEEDSIKKDVKAEKDARNKKVRETCA